MIGLLPTFIYIKIAKKTSFNQKMPEVKMLGKIICDPYENFLASRTPETRIFTNAALILPLAAGIRVNMQL